MLRYWFLNPVLLGKVADPRGRARKIDDQPEASCSATKYRNAKKKKKYGACQKDIGAS